MVRLQTARMRLEKQKKLILLLMGVATAHWNVTIPNLFLFNQKMSDMPTSHEIKCINKLDRENIHERITHVGGVNGDGTRWRITQHDAIEGIKRKEWIFYVTQNSKKVNVIAATSRYGYEYLKTEADTTEVNNLLSLPECPKI